MNALPDNIFWSLFLIAWFGVSWVALWLFAKMVDGGNPKNHYDHTAERKRKIARNGLKSRQGIR